MFKALFSTSIIRCVEHNTVENTRSAVLPPWATVGGPRHLSVVRRMPSHRALQSKSRKMKKSERYAKIAVPSKRRWLTNHLKAFVRTHSFGQAQILEI